MEMPARGVAAFSVAIRLGVLLLSAAALPVLWQCGLIAVYRCTHQCGERSNAASRKQSAAKQTSLAPHDSKARLQNGHDSQGFMAKPCTPHLIAQRLQLFKPQTGNVGDRGALPSRSLGGSRGPFSHVREWPPYCALPHAAGEPKTQPLRAAPPSAPAGCPKPRSRAYVASAEPRSALKSGRNALHSHPSSQRRRTPSPSFTSKVKTTASSVCALTR